MADAICEIAQRIADVGSCPDAYKLARQGANAYHSKGLTPTGKGEVKRLAKRSRVKAEYNPETLGRFAARLGADVTAAWLYERSPLCPDDQTPGSYLSLIMRPGEKVLTFDRFKSQGCEVWTHPGDTGTLNHLPSLQHGCEGAWFLSNPIDGQWREVARLKRPDNPTGRTRRAEENITSWRHGVLESDDAPAQLWLNALAQLRLPVLSITETGSASGAHAIVLVHAESKRHWDEVMREGLGPQLVRLGADLGALTAVRLTRLPNCHRGQTGRLQRLLYFNPEPDGTPLVDQLVQRRME
jgi:hypothetical protein